ncbi:MAG: glyceraldehyde 3-phosphate dehydrogenase NAD-binding domain-containing protein [Luminiphilus sp.]|nr:glyceraldehyde 3-phosphate dehydrogenase NAD-binding domain-containing protein [Luminiphilus sp.]
MKQRIAINGFGRIGRTVLRAWTARQSLHETVEIAAINEIADPETVAHLARYDSTHGRFPGTVTGTDDSLQVNGQPIALLRQPQIDSLPWRDLEIDLVIESTGAFSDRLTAEQHISSGARRVLFSQPAQSDVDATIVWGLNQSELHADHRVISAGSCTTNALCPVLKIIDDAFGIEAGTITTVHSAMNDQPVLDAYHHTDLRKTRAAFHSIIPVDTGLAVGIPRILPKLANRLTAHALRVPTLNVSALDITLQTQQRCDAASVNHALVAAAESSLAGILGIATEPLASCDFNGESCSGVIDASQTQVAGDRLVKVLVWFDNEWAYAQRLLDIVQYVGTLIKR